MEGQGGLSNAALTLVFGLVIAQASPVAAESSDTGIPNEIIAALIQAAAIVAAALITALVRRRA